MVKIVVTFASENEFAPWLELRKFKLSDWPGGKLRSAQIGGAQVGVVLTGVGPNLAKASLSRVIEAEEDTVRCCISSGLAGSLRPQYAVGDVLAAQTVVADLALDDSADTAFRSSEALLALSEGCGARIVGRFFSSPRLIATTEEKKYLGRQADAAEMESFGIFCAAHKFGVPVVAVRAVSDAADEDLPPQMNEVITDEGQVSIPRVIGKVALNPKSLPSLLRLGKNSKRAAVALCEFLDRYIVKVAEAAEIFETEPRPPVREKPI